MELEGCKVRVALGVPTMNNFKGLAELISSLWGEEYTPFLVNNWTHNNGVSAAWNEILKATQDYDLTVISNDDIVWHGGSWKALIDGWKNKPADAILITGTSHDRESLWTPAPDYSHFAVNARDYIDKVGWFDTNFYPAYHEDGDSHHRIKLAGFEGYSYREARTTHGGSKTQNNDPNNPVVSSPVFRNLQQYYQEKWGTIHPGQEIYDHPYNDSSKDWKYFR